MGAEEAVRIGLVARMVPDSRLEPESLALAREIMLMAPLAVAQAKQALWKNAEVSSLNSAIELEMTGAVLVHQTEDAREKQAAVKEKRDPVFRNR